MLRSDLRIKIAPLCRSLFAKHRYQVTKITRSELVQNLDLMDALYVTRMGGGYHYELTPVQEEVFVVLVASLPLPSRSL